MAAPRLSIQRALTMLALTAVYVTAAKLGLELNAVSHFATLVWPSTGIALAALLLLGPQLWPGVALGAFIVNLWFGAPAPVAAGIAIGNTLEVVVALRLLRWRGFEPAMARVRDVVSYVILAAIVATAISPTVGSLSLYAGGLVEAKHIADTWLAWWLGDAIGALVVAPPLLAWGSGALRGAHPVRIAELFALCCALLAASVAVLGDAAAVSSPLREPFILIAITIWAALRFGQRGTTSTTFAMAAFAIAATAIGRGPFAGHPLSEGLALLQVFVASLAVTGLVLCAAICERQARADELVRVNAELSSALSARDTFLSVASHELKTPLSALRLQAEVLLRMQPDLAPAMTEQLQRINRQVDRLNKLVVELLEVSRITAGRLELQPERVELTDVVREVAQRFEAQARNAGSALHVAVGGRIFGDWDGLRLDQVISNLLSNAIKYGRGKPVEIETSSVDGSARIRVRDHGVGIAPADQARVFDRFERGTPPRKVEGFGLGLWICRQIVDAMGGHIAFSSTVGVGSTFDVELPGVVHSETTLAKTGDAPATCNILVVEDDEDVLDGVARILRAEGYGVTCASDGRQALERVHAQMPTLMLLDLGMPIMDGRELLSELRASGNADPFPIVLMSADRELPRTAEELGVAEYVEKPLHVDVLLSAVARYATAEKKAVALAPR